MLAFLLDTFWFRAARLAPASWFRLSQGSRRQSFVAWIYDRSHAAAKRRFREQLPYAESGDAAGLSTLARVLLFLGFSLRSHSLRWRGRVRSGKRAGS